MNTKHTPGPWRVNAIKGNRIVGDETAPEFDKLQINNHNATVATVYHAADARLIASAPDLLAERDRLRAINHELVAALETARAYVGKAHADHAYDGCAVSADKVLAKIAVTLARAKVQP